MKFFVAQTIFQMQQGTKFFKKGNKTFLKVLNACCAKLELFLI
jgi:hypothetical protein